MNKDFIPLFLLLCELLRVKLWFQPKLQNNFAQRKVEVSVLCGREWPLDYSDVILGVEDDTALKCDIADCNGGDLDSINKGSEA
jgi:hypothetical protein